MFIELAFGIDDAEVALVTETPNGRPKVHTRAGASQGVPVWPFRDGVGAALRSRGTNMRAVYTRRADMNATYRSLVEEMAAAEQTTATGAEKRVVVIEALTAAGWVDDSNRTEVTRYINIIAWIARRPELLVAINRVRASSKCCIAV